MRGPLPALILALPGLLLATACRPAGAELQASQEGIDRWLARVEFEGESGTRMDRLARVFSILDRHGDPGTARLGEEFVLEFPDHEEHESILLRTAGLLAIEGNLNRAVELLELEVARDGQPSEAVRLRLGNAYEASHRSAEAVQVFDELFEGSETDRAAYLARFLSSYAKLYGGQETQAVLELERLSAELSSSEAPELARLREAAEFQLEVADSWKDIE